MTPGWWPKSAATNANTIDLVLWDRDLHPEIVETLKGMFDVVTVILVAIGSNIAKPGILAQATGAMARASISSVSHRRRGRRTCSLP
jgi:aspartate kinase